MWERGLVFIPVTLLALAQVMLKWQANARGVGVESRWEYFQALALSPVVWGALLLIGTSFMAWMLLR